MRGCWDYSAGIERQGLSPQGKAGTTGGGPAAGGQVPERAVPQLVQGPADAVRVVQRGGPWDRRPRPLTGSMSASALARFPEAGERRPARNTGPAARPASSRGWQEPGGGGGPVQVLGVAALATGAGPPELEVTDVQGEDPLGPGGGVIQQPRHSTRSPCPRGCAGG